MTLRGFHCIYTRWILLASSLLYCSRHIVYPRLLSKTLLAAAACSSQVTRPNISQFQSLKIRRSTFFELLKAHRLAGFVALAF